MNTVKQTKQHKATMGGVSLMRAALALCGVAGVVMAPAQNLVPNGSFEEYTECPDYWSQWSRCVSWISPPTQYSADYFSACAGTGPAGVPSNSMGYQIAQHGEAYMGLITYVANDTNAREVIAVHLDQPLNPGVPVSLCFRASPGGFGQNSGNSAQFATRGIGMRFYTGSPVFDFYTTPFPNSTALHLDQVLIDTSDWITVSGIYVPDSAYEWLAIANFYSSSLSTPIVIDSTGWGTNWSYAFVDNVSVSTDLSYCGATGISEESAPSIAYVESIFYERLRIAFTSMTSDVVDIEFLNTLGELVMRHRIPPGVQVEDIPTTILPLGNFIVTGEVRNRDFLHPVRVLHLNQ